MIAKIGHGTKIFGALLYNHNKVLSGQGAILKMHNMLQTASGEYTTRQLLASFLPFLALNKKTEKTALHISLNPDPNDKVSDEDFKSIADEYMIKMGYAEQPYIVFKHDDIDRTHIHIVSTVVDKNGNKISDSFEKRKSMEICRELEKIYNLTVADEKQTELERNVFTPVDYTKGDIKSQLAKVIRYLPKSYSFQNLGTYNALLSLFNITVEHVKKDINGELKEGLVYFALDEKGNKVSNPFKSSLFGKQAGLNALLSTFANSKNSMQQNRQDTTHRIDIALSNTSSEKEFKDYLIQLGINTVIRRNADGRLYGITFIDHNSKTVYNGSHIGKQYSANIFHDYFAQEKAKDKTQSNLGFLSNHNGKETPIKEELHPFFDFMLDSTSLFNDWGLLNSFLLDNMAEDPEEQLFEFNMKKKKRKLK